MYVAEYPAIQHRHGNGDVVTVRLKRQEGTLRATCTGCGTVFIYRKPTRSGVAHYKSPLLPPIKGNWDDDEH